MAYIILVRHGESEGNAEGRLSGQADTSLTKKGKQQARQTAKTFKHIPIQQAYVSELQRTRQTWDEIQRVLDSTSVPITVSSALNERDLGVLTHRNKQEVRQELGEQGYIDVIRGWDMPAPDGESLAMVCARVVPYFQSEILARAKAGDNVVVVSHYQTLRALIKFLDAIPDNEVPELTLQNAEAIIYEVDASGALHHRD